ncbi:hypothetical protein [uncultured Rothia sp.]|uniref:hypothetical protein n=1 Tax=uncultured Rothia sp. TaxID=316088 RepID=UPI00288B79B9|nr:hypothetical protein [uncultured Rothia sp.]
MAEDMPQDSSGSQKTSQDSGVIAGVQSSNSTGKSATVQNNQSNKKYDLGVLFVHGIGKQKPGDTFETMFWPIKNKLEEILSQNLSNGSTRIIKGYYKATKRNCFKTNTSLVGLDVELKNLNNYKNIAFRESHWHEKNINNQDVSFCKIIKEIIVEGVDIAQAALRIFLLKILQPRVATILFMLFLGFGYVAYNSSMLKSILQGDERSFLENQERWEYIRSIFTVIMIIFIATVAIKWRGVKSLCGQIQNSRLGYSSGYLKTVENNLKNIMGTSKDVLIISHSMGGYLVHKALSKYINGTVTGNGNKFTGSIDYIGLGSGLGPMSIIERGNPVKVSGNKTWSGWTFLLLYLALVSILICEWITLWFNLIKILDNSRTNDGYLLFVQGLVGIDAWICLMINFTVISALYVFVVFVLDRVHKIEELPGVGRYEFYYQLDLVGNTSRFVYPRNISASQLKNILSPSTLENLLKRFIFAHDMGYYMKNNNVVVFLRNLILEGIGFASHGTSGKVVKNLSSERRKLLLWYAALGLLGLVVLWGEFYNAEAHVSIAGIMLILPLLISLEYFAYIISYVVIKSIIYFLDSKYIRGPLGAFADAFFISIAAPSLLIKIIGEHGFLSSFVFWVTVALIILVILNLIWPYMKKIYKYMVC